MQKWIDQVKTKIFSIISSVRSQNDVSDIREAFVGYRDYFDKVRFETFKFNTDVNLFQQYVTSVAATGGGDIPEDMIGGLDQAIKLEWQSVTKCIILVADAPCHGNPEFHDYKEDPRNSTVPTNLPQAFGVLQRIRDMGIDLAFTKINDKTDKMLTRFHQIYDDQRQNRAINDISLSSSDESFVKGISTAITQSVMRRKAQSGGGGGQYGGGGGQYGQQQQQQQQPQYGQPQYGQY